MDSFKMKLNAILIFVLILLNHNVECWKPIVNTIQGSDSGSTSFSIHQSHPGIGVASHLHSSNSIGGDVPVTFVDDQHLSPHTSHTLGGDALTNEVYGHKHLASGGIGHVEDTCSVSKYAFNHEGTIHYRNKLAELEQFTICFWTRFTNHQADHTLLTYSVKDELREIRIWIANAKNSSYISMAIRGQSLYRLNYPLKMGKWHHMCHSWNGKTGEWQVWLKAERVGRGFHNRLVNHKISADGILFSGGPSITGPTSEGLHFELTLLQIYKVALTAGKAHRDHKHHHVHHFDHEGVATTTPKPPPVVPPVTLPMHALLANGQIPTRVRINLAGAQPETQLPQAPNTAVHGIPSQVFGQLISETAPRPQTQHSTLNTNFVNGQFHSGARYTSQQILNTGIPIPRALSSSSSVTFPEQDTTSSFSQFDSNPANVQIIDSTRPIFKRATVLKKIAKRDIDKKLTKRGLVMLGDGSIVDESLINSDYQLEGLAQFGIKTFKDDLKNRMNIEDEIKEHDREPAEEEVKAVMAVCSLCDSEPFKGAIVFGWNNAIVAVDNVIKGRSVGECGYF